MKIALVGQTACGKTAFLNYIAGKEFVTEHIPTIKPMSITVESNVFIDCPSEPSTISAILQNEAPDVVLVFIEPGFTSRALIAFVRLILSEVKILRVFPKSDIREDKEPTSFSCKTGQGVGRIMDAILDRNLWAGKMPPLRRINDVKSVL